MCCSPTGLVFGVASTVIDGSQLTLFHQDDDCLDVQEAIMALTGG